MQDPQTQTKQEAPEGQESLSHRDMRLMARGWRLTTAEIIYHLPDHPNILQTFIWQNLDLAPRFPALRRFLDFWQDEIEGRLHSVHVAHATLLQPAKVGCRQQSFWIH